jgi:hypothetical protein
MRARDPKDLMFFLLWFSEVSGLCLIDCYMWGGTMRKPPRDSFFFFLFRDEVTVGVCLHGVQYAAMYVD